MDRRQFLRSSLLAGGAAALGPAFWRQVLAAPAQPGPSPYGPVSVAADANGIRLPAGFSSRVVGVSGQPVGTTGYVWHPAPDGGATFATGDGGWIYTSNSEVPFAGGAGALRFAADGTIAGAHRILAGTSMNCAGGPTPWGTWLSCEEHDFGHVWECDPAGLNVGTIRRALGTFSHEAAAVDPATGQVYLTEDKPDSRLYRFTPAAGTRLDAGALEVLVLGADGTSVTWAPLTNPNPFPGQKATRAQVPESAAFDGGEGCWHDSGVIYFTTKGDNRVWALTIATQTLEIIYDDHLTSDPVLTGVDNVTMSPLRHLVVAEDGGSLQLVAITPENTHYELLQVVGHVSSEIAGPAFSPDGTRLYFSSQRGPAPAGPGITYEVTGPFAG